LARMQSPSRLSPSLYVRGNSPLFFLTPRNQRRLLLINQFLIPLSSIYSLLFKSWLASPAFQIQRSIDTERNHLALWWSIFARFPTP
jgi:hypothetical protein